MNTTSYPFVRLPLDLLNDERLSPNQKLLWCFYDPFTYDRDDRGQRRPPTVKVLMRKLNAGERSIYRWLKELEAHGWLEWQRGADRIERITQLTPDDRAMRPDGDLVRRATALLKQENASVAEFRAIVEAFIPLISETLPPESGTLPPMANSLPPESESLIVGSDSLPPGSVSLPPVAKSRRRYGFRTRQKPRPKNHENHENHEDHETSSSDDAGGSSLTATESFLRQQSVSKKKARQFRHVDLAAAQIAWHAEIPARGSVPEEERQKLIGRLLDRWEVAPPQPPAPPAEMQRESQLSEAEAMQRARAIAPADATEEEIAMLATEISFDGDEERALNRLYTIRWQAAHLPTLEPEVVRSWTRSEALKARKDDDTKTTREARAGGRVRRCSERADWPPAAAD